MKNLFKFVCATAVVAMFAACGGKTENAEAPAADTAAAAPMEEAAPATADTAAAAPADSAAAAAPAEAHAEGAH
jgi:hypothetical protein